MEPHVIELDEYRAKARGSLMLGTWGSYGIETLQLQCGEGWTGRAVTVVFRGPGTSTVTTVLADEDGLVPVPQEATAKAGSGTITIVGVDANSKRISADVPYMVKTHAPVDGAQTAPTPDQWQQFVAQVQEYSNRAQEASTVAGDSAQAAQDAEAAAESAKTYAEAYAGQAQVYGEAAQRAAQAAQAAKTAAVDAQAEADASAQEAEQWAEQAQQIAQGAMGWYATPQALQSAHPTGQNGQWAIVGATDTIWIWDSDTAAWVDSGSNMDLSQYYTKTEADARFGTAKQVQQAQSTAEQAQSTAEQAQSTAEQAQSTAEQAQSTAEQAQSTAEQAQSAAEQAQSTAEQAQSTADQAQDTADAAAVVEKIWENPSPTAEYAAQTISVPGLADYDMIIIFTNANGNEPYAYNPPTMATKMGNNEIYVTSYQGTFTRGFTVNFAAQTIAIGDAYTAGIDNRYLVPALIFGIKFYTEE